MRILHDPIKETDLRIALCFSGETRSLDLCLPSLKQRVLDRMPDCTVFVHTYDTIDASKSFMLPFDALLIEKQPLFDEKNYNERLGTGQKTGVKGILAQLRSLQRSNSLKTQYEEEHGMRFDWVIRIRPDSCFLSDFPDLDGLDSGCIHIPKLNDWGGYFDHCAFGSSALMDMYCNRLDAVDAYYQSGHEMHPETFLKYHLDTNQVTVQRPDMELCLLRKAGQEDVFHKVVFRQP